MQFLESVLTSVFLIPVLFAQNAAPPEGKTAEDKPATCVVSGRTVTATEGNPLKSARVVLVPERWPELKEVYAASSDAEGHFAVKDVPAGRYTFFAEHRGFVTQHYKARNHDDGPVLSMVAGQKVYDVLFRMAAAAVIAGRVTDEEGEAMSRVQVVALRRPTEDELEEETSYERKRNPMTSIGSAMTDDRGQYRIFGLKPGEYYIRVDDTYDPDWRMQNSEEEYERNQVLGSEYASVYSPGVVQLSQAQVIPIKAGEEAQSDVVMRHVKTVQIAGRVIGNKGLAANAIVHLEPADASDSMLARGDQTDDKGEFRVRNVAEGSYFIDVYVKDDAAPMYQSRARQKVEVSGDNIDGLTISLGNGSTIQGRITADESTKVALGQLEIFLRPTDDEAAISRYNAVKKDGTFEITSVPEGSYSLGVSGLEHEAYIKSVRYGSEDALEKGVQVEGTAAPARIEVTVASSGAELEGSVSDDNGAVAAARVRITPDPLTPYNRFRRRSAITDQFGHFSARGLPPGKYVVTAKPPASEDSSAYKSEPQSFALSENDHQSMQIKLVKAEQ